MGCPFCVPYIQVKSEFGIQWTCFIFQIRKSFKYLKCEHMPSCSVFFLKGGVKSKKKSHSCLLLKINTIVIPQSDSFQFCTLPNYG